MKNLGLALALLLVGCGDTTNNNSPDMTAVVVPHNFDQINSEIFQQSCANFSVCHGSKVPSQGNLDLKTDPYAALVGIISDNAQAKSEGKLRVKPCDGANSFLVIKLKLDPAKDTSPPTGYGNHMPYTNPAMPAEQIQAIQDWIDRGALKNEPPTVTGHTCQVTDMAMGGAHD